MERVCVAPTTATPAASRAPVLASLPVALAKSRTLFIFSVREQTAKRSGEVSLKLEDFWLDEKMVAALITGIKYEVKVRTLPLPPRTT